MGAGINAKIEIDDQLLANADGSVTNAFADNAIALLPSLNLGTLEYYKDSDWTDPVGNIDYTQAHSGAVLIGSERTKEGRFLEYKMNAAPNLLQPEKMAIITLPA